MLSPLLLQIQFFIFFNSLPKSPFDKIQPFAESSIFLTLPAPRKHIFSPTKQKTHEHINQKSPKLFDLAGFPGEQTDCLHMSTKLEHIPTKSRKYGQYLYNTNTARASLFPQNISSINFAPP